MSIIDPTIGEISMFGGNFNPRNWANCDGQLLNISQYTALYALIGTTYGGDGTTNFALPDLRGRVAMHTGSGTGLTTRPQGEIGGLESSTLTLANMPAHSHAVALNAKDEGNTNDPNGAVIAGDGTNSFGTSQDTTMAATQSESIGNNTPFNNLQPYLVVRFIIALSGYFPSRN